MPSILILDSKVCRGRPSFMAAPFEPPTRPAHSINARSINSRSLMLTAALKEMDPQIPLIQPQSLEEIANQSPSDRNRTRCYN